MRQDHAAQRHHVPLNPVKVRCTAVEERGSGSPTGKGGANTALRH